MLSHISCNYGIQLLFLPHNHLAAIPTSDDVKAQKLPGTDHVLSQVKGMHNNHLEDRSAPSPIPILPYHTRVHTSRAPNSDITHSTWIKTLPPFSFRLYTEGTKLPSGYLGSGWALYGKAKAGIKNTEIASGFFNLGIESEVFDVELHAVLEGLSFLATSDFSPRNLVICIDNTAAIGTLQDNHSNSEPARIASTLASLLAQKGWKISSLWTPAHRKIEGNEHADEMATKGAESPLNLCLQSFSSKTW
jgi:ribonuclease HI